MPVFEEGKKGQKVDRRKCEHEKVRAGKNGTRENIKLATCYK